MGNIANKSKGAVTRPLGGTLKVWLNTDVSSERTRIMRELDAERAKAEGRLSSNAKATVTAKAKKLADELEQVEAREQEHAHLLYFEKLPGLDFANISDEFPPRAGNPTDIELGFNTRATTLAAARANGSELILDPEGDFETPLEPGKKFRRVLLDDDDWKEIQTTGAGYDLNGLENLILNLNVYVANQMVARWKKD